MYYFATIIVPRVVAWGEGDPPCSFLPPTGDSLGGMQRALGTALAPASFPLQEVVATESAKARASLFLSEVVE